jgi:hypothetical protein
MKQKVSAEGVSPKRLADGSPWTLPTHADDATALAVCVASSIDYLGID